MIKKGAFNGRVIFDHIQKTAGTAVNLWIRDSLGQDSITPVVHCAHSELIKRYGGNYSILSAHIAFSGEGLDSRYQYVTCIREPIDRAISWLFYQHKNFKPDEIGVAWYETQQFIESEGEVIGSIGQFINNPYVEHFSSVSSWGATNDKDKLGLALDVIESYNLWGLYAELPIFFQDFAGLLGVPAPVSIPLVNETVVRPSADHISIKLKSKLEELNALDIEFYQKLRNCHAQARQRWLCPSVTVANWVSYERPKPRSFSQLVLTLISATVDGDGKMLPWQVVLFTLIFSLTEPLTELEIGIHVFDTDHKLAFGTNTTLLDKKLLNVKQGTHRLQYYLVVNLPEGNYTAGFAFKEYSSQGSRELAWFDKLVDFSVTIPRPQACIGYSSMSVVLSCTQISGDVLKLVEDATGTILFNALLGALLPGESFNLPVVLVNSSSQIWIGTHHNPITLAYHWFDMAGTVVAFEGERTPLPVTELRQGQSVSIVMRVVAPVIPGQYQLKLLPVQEFHCWFDDKGFTCKVLDVTVLQPATNRRYQGSDIRLSTQCGKREGTVLIATGQEGHLLYGPYVALSTGSYVARLEGMFTECIGVLDVVCTGGTLVLAKTDIRPVLSQATEISLAFELKVACSDLEVRLWLPANTKAVISALLIEEVNCRGSDAETASQSIQEELCSKEQSMTMNTFNSNSDINPDTIDIKEMELSDSKELSSHIVPRDENSSANKSNLPFIGFKWFKRKSGI